MFRATMGDVIQVAVVILVLVFEFPSTVGSSHTYHPGPHTYHPGPHTKRSNETFTGGKHTTSFLMTFHRGRSCDMVCTNMVAGVSCTNAPPYPMTRANGSYHNRNIISYNTNGAFALGFEQSAVNSFYLSIYTFYPSTNTAGPAIWTAKGPGHFAPAIVVDENATLSFLRNGVLQLRNSLGTLMWTTGTDKAGVKALEFNLDVGNLILFNENNFIIWQSVDN